MQVHEHQLPTGATAGEEGQAAQDAASATPGPACPQRKRSHASAWRRLRLCHQPLGGLHGSCCRLCHQSKLL